MKKLTYTGLMLIGAANFYAQNITNDSIISPRINLNDIIIKGDFFTDPTFVLEVNNQLEHAAQPKNVADLFKDVDGMNLIKRGNYAIDPSFRASSYEQLNIQYDGGVKAMQACPNRMDPVTTHVSPEDVEKIEIIKGPYTVRYGANFGGVVNLITSKPKGIAKDNFKGNIQTGYESNGNTYLTSLGLQYAKDKFFIKGNVGYRNFGNYSDGNGVEIPSAFKSTDYSLSGGINLNPQHDIVINWRQSFGRDVLHAGLPMDTETDDSSVFSIDYFAHHLEGLLTGIQVKAYYATVDHLMNNFDRPNAMMMEMESQVYSDTYGGKIETKWSFSQKLDLFTGLDMFNVKREGTKGMLHKKDMQGNMIPNPMWMMGDIWQDAYVNDFGIFAEGNYKISRSWVLKTGVRLDKVNAKPEKLADNFGLIYGNVEEKQDYNVSGHIGLKYAPRPSFIWEFAMGRGVRSANMVERYINYFNVGQDAYNYVGNPNLDPEVNHQAEVGFKNKMVLRGDAALNFGASAYYSMLSNYITAVVNPNLETPKHKDVKSFVNIDDAYKVGFELFFDSKFNERWSLETSLSYVYARNKSMDESLPMTPPFTAIMDVSYTTAKFITNLRFKAVSEQNQIAESFAETKTPGYGTLDFEINYIPIHQISLGASVLNILDKTYHNHQNFNFVNQSGFARVPINEPGRNFTIFARYNF
ncbi:TonB-dependent receptor [Flavobacteriaceae bacterium Ap0902]|nr:TonB-dependent receptor [Flavobacteriaceae bacterium Ap0902]